MTTDATTDPDDPTAQEPGGGPADSPAAAEPQPETPALVKPPAAPASGLTAAADATPLPGAHRGGFSRELTGPIGITIESAPVEPGTEDALDYTPSEWVAAAPRIRFGGWALAFAIVGLLVSFLVGWGFLLGVVAIIAGTLALRRGEPRGIPTWAIALAGLSILYSAGWLLWAAGQGALALV